MLPIIKNNVKENTTSTGIHEAVLSGAVSGYVTFSSELQDGESIFYYIENSGATDWEMGVGIYFNGVISRARIIYSSNSNAPVNFSAGTKTIQLTDNLEAPETTGSSSPYWYSGSGVPSSGTGANGDYYLNTANGDIYKKSGGTWSVIISLQTSLVSGTSIKSVNSSSLLGSGNLLAGSSIGGIVSISQTASSTLYYVLNSILSGAAFAGRAGRQIPMSASTFKNLFIRTNTAQPASGSLVVSLYVNSAATSISVTIAAGSAAGVYSDTLNTATIVNGDLVCWEVINNATTTSGTIQTISINNYA